MKKSPSALLCWFMFFISTVFYLYEFILRISPGVMADELLGSFHINATSLGLMSSVFLQAYAWMQIPVGIIFDKYSARKILFLACMLCAISTIVFSCTNLFWVAVISRFFMGVGAAFGFVGALKVAEQWLSPHRFAFISGSLISLGFLGAVISSNLLEWLIHRIGWSASLYYLGGLGIVFAILIYFMIKDAPRIQALQKQLSFKNAMSALFQTIKDRHIWINGFIGFCFYAPTSAIAELWGKTYLTTVMHFSSKQAVFVTTLIFLGWIVGAPIAGIYSDTSGNRRKPMFLGGIGAAAFLLMFLFISNLSYFTVCALLFLFGVFSSTEMLNFPYAKEIARSGFSATAIAVTNILTLLGAAFTQPLVGWLLDSNWDGVISNGVHVYSATAYLYAFSVLPILLIVGSILALFLRKTDYEIIKAQKKFDAYA